MSKGSLQDVLSNNKNDLTWKRRVSIALDALSGLEYLHSKKQIHKNIKSSNVLISSDWKACISDIEMNMISRTYGDARNLFYTAPEEFQLSISLNFGIFNLMLINNQ